MKPRNLPDDHARFSGHLRHYHRSGSQSKRTWDEWVDGKPATSVANKNRWIIVGAIVAGLVLAAIIAGLFIELR